MQDKPTLYGVQQFKEHAGGLFQADQWAKLRTGADNSGRMRGHGNEIMWFKDPGARDEFQKVFGGQSVTLHPKVNNDTEALDKAAKEMLSGR